MTGSPRPFLSMKDEAAAQRAFARVAAVMEQEASRLRQGSADRFALEACACRLGNSAPRGPRPVPSGEEAR